jgi:hypothetical protein
MGVPRFSAPASSAQGCGNFDPQTATMLTAQALALAERRQETGET